LDRESCGRGTRKACDFEIVQMLVVDTKPDEYVKRVVSKINATARMKVVANKKRLKQKKNPTNKTCQGSC
ncbi:hypothetical protein CMV_026712, partial [Castanea mollissima]